MLEANKKPKKQKKGQIKNPEECPNQPELVQTSPSQPLQNCSDLHVFQNKSGRSYTDNSLYENP